VIVLYLFSLREQEIQDASTGRSHEGFVEPTRTAGRAGLR
jgi:hypothetical protein